MIKNKHILPYIILFLIVFLGYWEITCLVFELNHDAANLSLPWKKFVSDSLRNGYLPLWNPYINMGWPQSMEISTWYYPSWLFALFGSYSPIHLNIEFFIHVYLGSVGMYLLLGKITANSWLRILGSTSYIFSGFMVGHMQHLGWIYFACWLPLFIYQLVSFTGNPNFISSLKLAIISSLLFLSSYVFFSIHLLLILFICGFFYITSKQENKLLSFKYAIVVVIITFLICSPAIYSVYVHYEYIFRTNSYSYKVSTFGSINFYTIITYFFPYINTSLKWEIDVAFNNVFIGLYTLSGVVIYPFLKNKKQWITFIYVFSIFFLMLSFGGNIPFLWDIVRKVPFYDKLRFSAQFRIFSLFGFCLVFIYVLDKIQLRIKTKHLIFYSLFFVFCTILVMLFISSDYHNKVLFQFSIWFILFLGVIIGSLLMKKHIVILISIASILSSLIAFQMNYSIIFNTTEYVLNIHSKFNKLPNNFSTINNARINIYDQKHPPIGNTRLNQSVLYHEISWDCYHPFDTKNFHDFSISKEFSLNRQKELIFQLDSNSIQTSDISLSPYGIQFSILKMNDNKDVIIQLNSFKYMHVLLDEKEHEWETKEHLIHLKKLKTNSSIEIKFIPPSIFIFFWVSVLTFLTTILAIILIGNKIYKSH